MQTIYPVALTPEQYVEQNYQKRVRCPENCPNCGLANSLEVHGYYHRYLTQSAVVAVLMIWVRRFICTVCEVTVSCLPDFAQPYRVVNTATVQAGFDGQETNPDVWRWQGLIDAYWKRFTEHLPLLTRTVGNVFGRCPLRPSAHVFWLQLKKACGGLATATRQLVDSLRTCLFGTYRCHQRPSVSR
jgi:hypothetical protein